MKTTTTKKRVTSAPRKRTLKEIALKVAAEAAAAKAPARAATVEDLRALPEAERQHICDFIISGVAIADLRRELTAAYGLAFGDDAVVVAFYQEEARRRWETTLATASADADAMINVLRHSNLDFSEALLSALGQEAFRMITQRKFDSRQVEKFTRLLLQARAQDVARARTRETLALQREKMERQFQSQLEKALKALAAEIRQHPEAAKYFALFRAKLREEMASVTLMPEPKIQMPETASNASRADGCRATALPRTEVETHA